MTNEGNNKDEVTKLLRALVAILIKGTPDAPRSMREQIVLLSSIGLSPKEISVVIGRTRTYVSKELAVQKSKVGQNGK